MKNLTFIILILIVAIFNSCALNKNLYKGYQKLELKKYKDFLFVDLTLNGKHSIFLIDSGSSKSLIDISKASTYNFKFLEFGDEKFAGIGGVEKIYIVYDYEIKNIFVSFFGINLENLNPLFGSDNFKIVGILGADFLNSHNAILNFENNFIYFKN